MFYEYFDNQSPKDLKGVLIVSGNKSDMGEIHYTNNALSELSGYQKSELIDNSINILMPKMIQEVHDHFFINFYDQSRSTNLIKIINNFLLRKDKFFVPIFFLIKSI